MSGPFRLCRSTDEVVGPACVCGVMTQSCVEEVKPTVNCPGHDTAQGERESTNLQFIYLNTSMHTHTHRQTEPGSLLSASIIVLLCWLPASSPFCGAVNPLCLSPACLTDCSLCWLCSCGSVLPSCGRLNPQQISSCIFFCVNIQRYHVHSKVLNTYNLS